MNTMIDAVVESRILERLCLGVATAVFWVLSLYYSAAGFRGMALLLAFAGIVSLAFASYPRRKQRDTK